MIGDDDLGTESSQPPTTFVHGLGSALLLGEAKHATDNLDPIVADALPRDAGEALRFAFLASEFS